MRVIGKIVKELKGRYIRRSVIHPKAYISAGSTIYDSSIGEYSYCGYNCKIISTDIGKYCSIADDVIIGGAAHPIDWVSTSPVFVKGKNCLGASLGNKPFSPYLKTTIGNDVWIGDRAVLKSGISVGTGAVIGMSSVVTKDIPPYEIWAGNPAHKIRDRFSEDIKKQLIASEWWNLKESEIASYSVLIDDPKLFLETIKKRKGNI